MTTATCGLDLNLVRKLLYHGRVQPNRIDVERFGNREELYHVNAALGALDQGNEFLILADSHGQFSLREACPSP